MVKIKINGEGLTYEKETDLQKAGQIIAFLNADTSSTSNHNKSELGILPGNVSPRQSPRQSLMASDAKTNTEKIVVLADFICKRDSLNVFSPKEIQVEFKRAGEPLPKNFTRDFINAVVQGYILETDEHNYVLTDLAVDALREGFNTQRSSGTSITSKRRKGGKSKVAVLRDEVRVLEITPNLEGIPKYWEISTKGMRIIWLLTYADHKGISDGLSSAEISHLASKLKDQIKVIDFTALSKNNIKKGFMTPIASSGLTKILKVGIDALEALKSNTA